ncbi:MAG: hypothetical protein EBZ77_05975, partial [Chitinophagia bacterium]|nr:hypothetical protein [Chitinophagia bacterium]
MEFKILAKNPASDRVFIVDDYNKLPDTISLTDQEAGYLKKAGIADQASVTFNRYDYTLILCQVKEKRTLWDTNEGLRKTGADIQGIFNRLKVKEVTISNCSGKTDAAILLAEGMALGAYQFLKYKTDIDKQLNTLSKISFTKDSVTVKE